MSISNKVKSFFQAVMKPSPVAVSQAMKAIASLKPHAPLIRFRKGLGDGHGHGSAATGHPASSSGSFPSPAMPAAGENFLSAPSTPLKPNQALQYPTVEDWQLPHRFRRRPVGEEEIECINRGGPDYDPPKPKGKK